MYALRIQAAQCGDFAGFARNNLKQHVQDFFHNETLDKRISFISIMMYHLIGYDELV